MGEIWGGGEDVEGEKDGCLGEKELHVCTEYIQYNSTVYLFYMSFFFFMC